MLIRLLELVQKIPGATLVLGIVLDTLLGPEEENDSPPTTPSAPPPGHVTDSSATPKPN